LSVFPALAFSVGPVALRGFWKIKFDQNAAPGTLRYPAPIPQAPTRIRRTNLNPGRGRTREKLTPGPPLLFPPVPPVPVIVPNAHFEGGVHSCFDVATLCSVSFDYGPEDFDASLVMAESNGPRLLISLWAITAVALIFLVLRVVLKRWFRKTIGWDDYLLGFSWVRIDLLLRPSPLPLALSYCRIQYFVLTETSYRYSSSLTPAF
jgi:hypothetical protein